MPIAAAYMVPHPPMIVPRIGNGSEQQIRETVRAYEAVAAEIAEIRPETIIITSPHAVMYADYFHVSPGEKAEGDFGQFRAPDVRFRERYDTELVKAVSGLAREKGFPAGMLGERDRRLDHGTMVPLYFIRQRYKGGKIVRIGLSGLSLSDHYRLGMMIKEAAEDLGRKAVYIASGDLSHKLREDGPYGFAPEGPEYDARIMDVCARAAFGELFDFDEDFCDKAAECGHRSFVMMAGAFDGLAVKAEQLSHEDVTGVGYGICTFYPQGGAEGRDFLEQFLTRQTEELAGQREKEDAWVRLARQSVESYVREGRELRVPEGLPPELLHRRAGAFVSIHENGRLRGCIGTIGPTADCLAREIIQNAVSASTRDPRFQPIRPEELPWLEISVDVLGEPEDIASEAELDVKKYGVIVTSGRKRGLLLPDLEGVDTPAQQVAIAREKAGIRPKESVSLQRFRVVRHH
jgi:AmmeMemoRadiSam system protein A/AmmeMemoRadiSam system protein B